MREYLSSLVAVTLFGGLVRMLAPEGNLQKYLRLTVGLCLVCAMMQPFLGLLSEGKNFPWDEWLSSEEYDTQNYDEIYNQSLQSGTKSQAKKLITEKIYQAFSFSEETARVEALFLSENETISLQEIVVTLEGRGVLTDPREIVAFVREEWNCPCTVVYE